MKVVISNSCYGGFELSYEEVMYYVKLKGIKLYAYVEKWEDDLFAGKTYDDSDRTIIPFEERESKDETIRIYYAIKKGLKNMEELNRYLWNEEGIKRDDPAFVKMVEDLGGKASGRFAKLRVVEIPDDVDWEITEYNGLEQVEEKHRIWR